MEIGNIGNYYGGLEVKEENGKYYWGIGDWDGICWDEIPVWLYNTLVNYKQSTEPT